MQQSKLQTVKNFQSDLFRSRFTINLIEISRSQICNKIFRQKIYFTKLHNFTQWFLNFFISIFIPNFSNKFVTELFLATKIIDRFSRPKFFFKLLNFHSDFAIFWYLLSRTIESFLETTEEIKDNWIISSLIKVDKTQSKRMEARLGYVLPRGNSFTNWNVFSKMLALLSRANKI